MKNLFKTLFAINQLSNETQVALMENQANVKSGKHLLDVTAVAIDKVGIATITLTTVVGVGCNIAIARKLEKTVLKNHPVISGQVATAIGAVTGLGISQVILGVKHRNELVAKQQAEV